MIAGTSLFTQGQIPDFETYRRQQEQDFRQFVARRDSAMKALNRDFEKFVDQRNREFAAYVRNEWERMQIFAGIRPEPGPKPNRMPSFNPAVGEHARERVPITTKPPTQARVELRDVPSEPIPIRPVTPSPLAPSDIAIDFYGRQLGFPADRSFRGIRANGIAERDVAQWFETAAATNFAPTLISLLETAQNTGMNDWALFMAAQQLSARLANNNPLTTRLYTWFLLMQAGYDIRLARNQQQLLLLLPFAHTVYNTPRLIIDNVTFYIIGGTAGESIFTFRQNIPGAYRLFDMNFYKSPLLALQPREKTLVFEFEGKEQRLTLQYDPVLVAMLAQQPQAHMNIYLDAGASNILAASAERVIEPVLQPMSDTQKVSYLLKLAQTSFQYKTDIEQFGRQRYMVPDEVIHYAFSDCDDRAVFFAWLVRNYARQKVAALLYPGHLATAVHFPGGNPHGDYVIVDGMQFVVADPTYINAPIGLTMPEFRGTIPEAFLVDPQLYRNEQNLALWQKLHEAGAMRGNTRNDIILGREGHIFATGYFINRLQNRASRIRLENFGDRRTAFVGAFEHTLLPRWLLAFETTGDATGFAINRAPNDNLIVAGSFSGGIKAQNITINAAQGKTELFLACINPEGRLLWMQKVTPEPAPGNNKLAYTIRANYNGEIADIRYFNDPRESENRLFTTPGEILLTGTFGNTSGISVDEAPVFASGGTTSFADMLIQKNRELQQRNFETTIAGLFAAIYLSKSEGVVFPGSVAQEAIRKANPRFPQQFPETFANIGKISFLRNKSGIIEIRTENSQDVFFDKMRIRNGSTMRVRTLANGDEQIDILSNIHVGQLVVWYQLNFIRLNHRNGDLLFDYRSNNTQVTMNLKRDILN